MVSQMFLDIVAQAREQLRKDPEHQKQLRRIKMGMVRTGPPSTRAPKLRFKPGQFVEEKKTGQLYEILVAYRLKSSPNEWMFELEERDSNQTPETILSILCAHATGNCPHDRVQYEPVRSYGDIHTMFASYIYHHGSGKIATNKELINEFILLGV